VADRRPDGQAQIAKQLVQIVVGRCAGRGADLGTVSKHFNRGGETSPSTLALPLGSTHYPPICNNAIFGFYLLPARRPWCVLTFWFYLLPPPFFVFVFCYHYYFILFCFIYFLWCSLPFFATSFATAFNVFFIKLRVC
jgi:hypothetical protein